MARVFIGVGHGGTDPGAVGYLVEKDVRFEIRALTADGVQSSWVQTEQELSKAIDTLLCAGEAKEGSIRDFGFAASWQYHIGGEPDEA